MGRQHDDDGVGDRASPDETADGTSTAGDPSWLDKLERPGLMVGPYKLLQEIGEGGMGVVYMAEQLKPVHRRVALKVIKLGMDTRHVIARFEAERQALAMMDHPNIAKALDAGATGSGRPYFVMELVRGIPITDYCDQNRLDTRTRLELFVKVCRAVQHAHQKGIIHRDLKPSNVMITLHDGEPVPKVIDFGIAKATSERQLTDKTLFTNYGQMVGTPNYVSPEQAEMSGIDIDTRSDIYSLGVLLYRLLTGRTPLDVETVNKTPHEIQQLIREKTPHKPSTLVCELGEGATVVAEQRSSEPAKLGKQLRGDLDWIVMKCLEKDRTRRYETANALALDLERHLDNVAVLARPPSRLYQLQKFAQRNKVLFASGVAVTFSMISAVVISLWQAARANEQAFRARKAETVAENHRAAAQARAVDLAKEIRRNYFSSMLNAAKELEAQHIGRFREIMDAQTKVSEMIDDPRGWEWYYLQAEARQQETMIQAHRGTATAVEWSPDGRHIATAGADGNLVLWDATSRRQLQVLKRRKSSWRALAWSPDSNRLAASGDDPTIEVWDVTQRRLSRSLRGHFAPVTELDWAPGGRRLASAGQDKQLVVWDTISGSPLADTPSSQAISAMAWRPNSEEIAYSLRGEQGRTFLWNLGVDVHASLLSETFLNGVNDLSWSSDGGFLVAGTGSPDVRVWEIATGQLTESRVHDSAVASVAWHPHQDFFASVSTDGAIRVWHIFRDDMENFDKREPVATLLGNHSSITSVGWSHDGERLITAGVGGNVGIWDPARTGTGHRVVEQFPDYLTSISWSRDGAQIATAGPMIGKVYMIDPFGVPLSRDEVKGSDQLSDLGETLVTATWIPGDGRLLATASEGNGLQIWDWDARQMVKGDMFGTGGNIACWSPGGERLIALIHNKAFVWDRETGGEIKPGLVLPASRGGERATAQAAAWSPDGRHVATGGEAGSIELWDGLNFAHVRTINSTGIAASESVIALEFSPDSGRIASGTTGGTVAVHSIDGEQLHSAKGHAGEVKTVTWRPPDGDRIASAGQGGMIQLIETENYEWALKIPADEREVYQIRWSPDGNTLAGTGYENSLRIWRALSPGDLVPASVEPQRAPTGDPTPLIDTMRRLWSIEQPPPSDLELRDAQAALMRILNKSPGDPYLIACDALLASELADGDAAIEALSRSIASTAGIPSRLRKRLLVERARLRAARGDYAAAGEDNRSALGFPERDPAMPEQAIDLSPFYTQTLTGELHSSPGNTLASLQQTIGVLTQNTDIEYDVRGVVHLACDDSRKRLAGEGSLEGLPREVNGIPVGGSCEKIHFLHASGWSNVADGTEIGEIIIHLEGRDEPEQIVLEFAQPKKDDEGFEPRSDRARVWDWWYSKDVPLPQEAVWEGTSTVADRSGRRLILLEHHWENPHPDARVLSIDYRSWMTEAAPFLVGITVSPAP